MVARRRSHAILFLSFVLSAGSAQAVLLDDFNRPNSPVLGADWIQDIGDGFRIEYGKASALLPSIAVWDSSPLASHIVTFDVFNHMGGDTEYAALVLGFASYSNHLFIKVQDNGGLSPYNNLYFYFGENGSNNGAWAQSGGVPLDPFFRARITAELVGTQVNVLIDTDFDGVADQAYSRAGVPTALLGTRIGIGALNDPYIDLFSTEPVRGLAPEGFLPEPTSLSLLAVGALAGLARRRRRLRVTCGR